MNTREASQRKRRIIWTCAVLALLLVLAITPPLLNVNRLQRRIAASIGASLGRTVHLDRVTLHLLPVPGFTLANLVVSEENGFGLEPVIRANTVEVTLRPSSLWRQQVEFSTIKFIDPSLNLVRNADGEWNIQSLLMHAVNVDTAPTAQQTPGREPRFPYVEATGARVNIKEGDEKKPFSLTETDFALWLPSAQQWKVRLEGKLTRTDTNISDPGTIRIEGTLQRAATIADVPVDLVASWDGSPLGEASKLLTGRDAQWRGSLAISATLIGKLAAAQLTTKIHATDVRRADFIPVVSMDVRAECAGTLDVAKAVVTDADCSLNVPAPEGSTKPGYVALLADRVNLSNSQTVDLHAGMTNVSNAWLLDWARLFSQRIPPGERPGGSATGTVALLATEPDEPPAWQGEIHDDLIGFLPWKPSDAKAQVHSISIATSESLSGQASPNDSAGITGASHQFFLAPVALTPPGKTPELIMSGDFSRAGYTLRLAGLATDQQIQSLRATLPPLGDGVQQVLPAVNAGPVERPLTVNVTCTRLWAAAQNCSADVPAPAKKPRRAR